MRVLFWNLQKKELVAEVAALVQRHEIDLAVIAEIGPFAWKLPGELARLAGNLNVDLVTPTDSRVEIIVRRPWKLRRPEVRSRWTMFELDHPFIGDVLVCGCHLESQLNKAPSSKFGELVEFGAAVRSAAGARRCERQVIVGDLNADPYSDGILSAIGLSALPCRRVVTQRSSRAVRRGERLLYYNPMWSLLGDASPGPPGTHYRSKGEDVQPYWHMLDQFIVSAALADRVVKTAILTEAGELGLRSCAGLPRRDLSDHFPIFMELNDVI